MKINKLPYPINPKLAVLFLFLFTILSVLITFILIPKIPQWSSYHLFADTRKIWIIPNFSNVISNVLFFIVSIFGFKSLHKQYKNKNVTEKETIVFLTIFIGILLTAIGSSYYHWSPNNVSLIWDRIPMTIVFMSLLSLTIMERMNLNLGFWLLAPLIALGIFSVLYWHGTELLGQGDLRLYGFVQFYSIILILAILYFFPKNFPPLKVYLWMFGLYGIAKVLEQLDLAIYSIYGIISGHTLKHIIAAMSAYCAVIMVNSKQIST